MKRGVSTLRSDWRRWQRRQRRRLLLGATLAAHLRSSRLAIQPERSPFPGAPFRSGTCFGALILLQRPSAPATSVKMPVWALCSLRHGRVRLPSLARCLGRHSVIFQLRPPSPDEAPLFGAPPCCSGRLVRAPRSTVRCRAIQALSAWLNPRLPKAPCCSTVNVGTAGS